MEENKVVIVREFDAPRERVWKTWTEPEEIKKWWGPKNFIAPSIEVDFREGGTYLFCMHGAPGEGMPEQDYWSTGTYKEIVPMEKIVCTDSFADKDGNIVSASEYGMPSEIPLELSVTITFEELDENKTRMTLTHVGMIAGTYSEQMEEGWNQSFDKLTESLQ
jgi:uncharacterized protein YndB with AHSA1/START domain